MSDQPSGTTASPNFNVLSRVLVKYFPSPKNGGNDRTDELRDRFQKSGGTGLEFEGFMDQLRAAALDPDLASAVLRDTFGSILSPEDATERLVDTYDFLTDGGKYSRNTGKPPCVMQNESSMKRPQPGPTPKNSLSTTPAAASNFPASSPA
ncbi:hypothetical protein GCM10025867_46950 (plasmid) [Frondihabitans sucicola]|uniref:DUF3349 domain-containing protein n=1 Tax=Frondihabitans sucicola TaxID=1268041 RepID=A0ABM8GVF5_9MICO|nr:hypothetical protein [Frondihabitans sucicola]BDZ52454.1 hypothetical protein GCM10025867_46950 [Frondihabitans sucicola]